MKRTALMRTADLSFTYCDGERWRRSLNCEWLTIAGSTRASRHQMQDLGQTALTISFELVGRCHGLD